MKLDLLVSDSLECPIVRLSGFSVKEAKSIGESLRRLAAVAIDRIDVHDLPFIEVEGNVRLVFRIGDLDKGSRILDSKTIECELKADSWADVASLVEPFESGSQGYQWLFHSPEGPSILMSPDGEW